MNRFLINLIPISFLICYGILPLYGLGIDSFSVKLLIITCLGILGYYLGILKKKKIKVKKLSISYKFLNLNFYLLYFMVFYLLLMTGEKIPIFESFRGTSGDLIAIYREDFIKNRSGFEGVLKYLYMILGGSIVPILIVYSMKRKNLASYILPGFYFLTSIVVMAKANFLRIAIPLLFNSAYHSKKIKRTIFKGLIVIVGLIYLMYNLAGQKTEVLKKSGEFWSSSYFSPNYVDLIIWRVISIPIVTARDWLVVFQNQFSNNILLGKTSGFLSFFIPGEKINYENIVFEYQWGGIGNANANFLMEGYVNFGYAGVFVYGIIAAFIVKFFLRHGQLGVISVPLFAYFLFNAGLIGTLLSNGFILLIIVLKYTNYYEKTASNIR